MSTDQVVSRRPGSTYLQVIGPGRARDVPEPGGGRRRDCAAQSGESGPGYLKTVGQPTPGDIRQKRIPGDFSLDFCCQKDHDTKCAVPRRYAIGVVQQDKAARSGIRSLSVPTDGCRQGVAPGGQPGGGRQLAELDLRSQPHPGQLVQGGLERFGGGGTCRHGHMPDTTTDHRQSSVSHAVPLPIPPLTAGRYRFSPESPPGPRSARGAGRSS